MYCPNCGLANEMGAKFCANCGTTLAEGAAANPSGPLPPPPQAPQFQQPYQPPYQPAPPLPASNSMAKNIGLGCLIAVLIFFFIGLSCTRACIGHRRGHLVRYI